MTRRCGDLLGVAIATTLVAATALRPLAAQVVRGTATERGTGAPVAGAVLSVLDQRGRVIGEALSDENGTFEIRLPAAGTFSLDAKRIGVRRMRLAPFAIGEGETRQQPVVFEPIPTVLGSVNVTGRSSCYRRPAENERTAALWEDARAALTATLITRRAPSGIDTVVKFMRKLDVRTWKVLFEQRTHVPAPAERPFRSLPADDLSANGYVRVAADGTTDYFAPDADVLLSDTFLADHCFRVQPGIGSHEGQVGLAFEPVRGRKTPDVRGVLWIDAKTSELRTVEFEYTWLPHEERPGEFGGIVSFFRTPAGRWIVRSWRIRLPEFGRERWTESMTGERIPLPPSRTPHVVRIMEEGGAVPVGALLNETGTVRGTVVVDSASNRPVVNATVALGGTADSTRTGTDGGFTLPWVAPGSYTVVLRHPLLDSLGVEHLAATVDVTVGSTADLRLPFPSNAELAARLCGGAVDLDREAIVRFILVDAGTGVSLGTEQVVVTRPSPAAAAAEVVSDSALSSVVQLDAQGSFVACGLPGEQLVRIASSREAARPWRVTVRATAGGVGWSVLRVRREPHGR